MSNGDDGFLIRIASYASWDRCIHYSKPALSRHDFCYGSRMIGSRNVQMWHQHRNPLAPVGEGTTFVIYIVDNEDNIVHTRYFKTFDEAKSVFENDAVVLL